MLGLISAVLVQLVGYRLPALPPGMDPVAARDSGLRAYQKFMLLRFVVPEPVAIIGLALTFAVDSNTVLPYLLAACISLALMGWHVWPSPQLIERVQQQLDRRGGQSQLRQALFGEG